MQIKKLKKSVIATMVAIVLLGTGLGFGLGFGLNSSNSSSSSEMPFNREDKRFNFEIQNVNSRLNSVLAVSITEANTNEYGDLAYITNTVQSSLTLTKNDSTTATFSISTGQSNPIANGFAQNGHLYIPIQSSSVENTTYMEVEDTTSNNGSLEYLYIAGIGYFDANNDNYFTEEFTAQNLSGNTTLDITISSQETADQVLQPANPENKTVDFTTENIGSSYGTVLNTQINDDVNVSNYIYLDSTSTTNISFEGTNFANKLNIVMQTGNINLLAYSNGTIYIPIDAVVLNAVTYDYVNVKLITINDVLHWYFDGLSIDVTQDTAFAYLNFLDSSVSLNESLIFAVGN